MLKDIFQYEFMKNAFLAILCISPLLGLLGTMVVQKRMAYFSDALGHCALTGVAIGVILSLSDLNIAMVIFGWVFALILNRIRRKKLLSSDTVISVLASAGMAVGLAILSRNGTFSNYSAMLVGDVLSIKRSELLWLFILLLFGTGFFLYFLNSLTAMSIHETLAKSSNIRVNLVEDIFSMLIATVVMLSIRWVGILLISALFILPAAASRNISENMREYTAYTIIFSLFSGILGLVLSYMVNIATGPVIVMIAAVIFFGTYIYGKE